MTHDEVITVLLDDALASHFLWQARAEVTAKEEQRADPNSSLVRGRELAEQAADLKLKHLVGALLVLGRVADGEVFVVKAVNVSAPIGSSDMGLVINRFARARDALAMSMSGWVVARVAHGSRLVGPLPGDVVLARDRLGTLGLDWRRPLYEQAS